MCFIENQLHGVNFHDQLTPEESAKYIIQHVEDGVAIAKKAKIPQIVIDFILSHHGKSQTTIFIISMLMLEEIPIRETSLPTKEFFQFIKSR